MKLSNVKKLLIFEMVLGVKLNSRCFIRDGVISIIFTEVRLKPYCVEIVDITYSIQYFRANSLVEKLSENIKIYVRQTGSLRIRVYHLPIFKILIVFKI